MPSVRSTYILRPGICPPEAVAPLEALPGGVPRATAGGVRSVSTKGAGVSGVPRGVVPGCGATFCRVRQPTTVIIAPGGAGAEDAGGVGVWA